ncbi:unnamed protein product [Sympodiomycopsis kandeliae]
MAPRAQDQIHPQERPPAPPVPPPSSKGAPPPLPVLRRYEGKVPDPTTLPILLPLLTPHEDVKNRTSPPPERWSAIRNASQRTLNYQNWQISTHTFPAAYPRSHPNSTAPESKSFPAREDEQSFPLVNTDEEKKQKKKHLNDYYEYMQRNPPLSYHPETSSSSANEKAQGLKDSRQSQLWNVINRYAPTQIDNDPEAVTLIFGHGTGLHKETWEPAMRSILTHLSSFVKVKECWSIDMIMCGQSCQLNQDDLGEVVHMHDHARDLLNFVTNYLPSGSRPHRPSNGILPRQDNMNNDNNGRLRPRIILVAHSVSASMWGILSHLHPGLFESFASIDNTSLKYTPQIAVERPGMLNGGGSQIVAITRKDAWPSRQDAIDAIRSNRVYSKWHPDCLDLFLQYGLRTTSSGHTTLTCPKRLEAAGYRSIWLASYLWTCMSHRVLTNQTTQYPNLLSLRIGKTFLLNEEHGNEYQQLVNAAGGKVDTWIGNGEEHLIVETEPDRLGGYIAEWIKELERSRRVEKRSRL